VSEVLPALVTVRDGLPVTIRGYESGDRARLEAFYDSFEPKRAAQGLPPSGADRVERWLDAVLPTGIHLLAEVEGRLIGHGLLCPMEEGVVEYAVWLHQDFRSRGIGTAVNRIAVEAAREAGFRRIWLSVEPGNRAALRSYSRAGFRMVPGTVFSLEAEMVLDLEE